MSPRPRTVSDDEILAAASVVIARKGPAKLTLADVGEETGLAPATLVQRFGSKRGLLLALARSASEGMEECFTALRHAHSSPLRALLSAATEMTRHVSKPEEMANHLAFLQLDLADPEFSKLMLESSRQMLAGYRRLLDEAVEKGELRACDTSRLARAVGAVAGGSLIAWAVYREGTAENWVRKDIDTVIAPYRTKRAGGPRSEPRKRS
jgi:AcrR family transcriptional regulator